MRCLFSYIYFKNKNLLFIFVMLRIHNNKFDNSRNGIQTSTNLFSITKKKEIKIEDITKDPLISLNISTKGLREIF